MIVGPIRVVFWVCSMVQFCWKILRKIPRKTNMSTENQWLEDVFPIEIVPF